MPEELWTEVCNILQEVVTKTIPKKKKWNKAKWLSEEGFHTVVLVKTPESPWDSKEVKPVRPKGNQPWIFTERTDIEAETPILWPSDAKSKLIGKDPNAGKDWGQEKGLTGDEMVGWHHRLNGHEFEQAPGDSEGEGSLVCYSPWISKSQTPWGTKQQQEKLFSIVVLPINILTNRVGGFLYLHTLSRNYSL